MGRLSKEDREFLKKSERNWVGAENHGWRRYPESIGYGEGFLRDPFRIPTKNSSLERILRTSLGRYGMALLRKGTRRHEAQQARINKLVEELRKEDEAFFAEFIEKYWDKLPYHERQALTVYLKWYPLWERMRQERLKYYRAQGDEKRARKLERRYKKKPL